MKRRNAVLAAAVLGLVAVGIVLLAPRTEEPPPPPAPRAPVQQDLWALHLYEQQGKDYRILELRPRTRTIPEWRVLVPAAQAELLLDWRTGPPGRPPAEDQDAGRVEQRGEDAGLGEVKVVGASTPIGPDRSAYLVLKERIPLLLVGPAGGPMERIDTALLTPRGR